MADTDREDRTQPATQKRLDEARREGNIPRSRDLTAAAVMITAGIALTSLGGSLGGELGELLRSGLSLSRDEALDATRLGAAFSDTAMTGLRAIGPVLLITLVAALAAPLSLGGWAFSPSALAPDFSRLNPVTGVGRMFAIRSWVELGKALAKFLVVAGVAALFIHNNLDELLGLGREPVNAAIGHSLSIAGRSLISLTCALILIAAVDVPFQLWQYHQDLRMTRDEVRQEGRESEGSPEMKNRIRALQREMSERRMMLDVPQADVIVVNPTHYAVALRYDDKKMRAPTVVAKGVDLMAARIREVASEHKVPIFEAPPLARALHRNVDIGNEIPAGLYVAVAQVLTYIFQLRTAQRDHATPPPVPTIEVADS
jgi:flagellar biosynthesis protein FlhB